MLHSIACCKLTNPLIDQLCSSGQSLGEQIQSISLVRDKWTHWIYLTMIDPLGQLKRRELEKKAGRGFDAGHTRQSGQGRHEPSLQIC